MAATTLLLGTRKGLLVLERGASGWRLARRSHGGVPVVYADADPRSGDVFALLEHGHWGGKLSRSRDGARTFEELPAPKYPDHAEVKDGVKATLGYLWCFQAATRDQPGRCYIGTVPGGLFRSDDGGATYALVEGLWNHPSRKAEQWFSGGLDREYAGICSIICDPRRPERMLVGVSCAGVFETEDDGRTWTGRNKGLNASFLPNPEADYGHDPHFTTMCAAEPDVLWMQNHCGIFRSTDGARTWKDVSQKPHAFFGFAIAADARNPERAWVVPGVSDEQRMAVDERLQVCRTDDGGKTWDPLRKGLPAEAAFDVVYRHALDAEGDQVAFGSTTGNVYASANGGDSWECVGSNFPPVYSVRFLRS
jgi:photosystem II stability/assembly factor-like uncharacterized protein